MKEHKLGLFFGSEIILKSDEDFDWVQKWESWLENERLEAVRKYKDEQEGVRKTYDDAIENQIPLAKETYTISKVTLEEKVEDAKEDVADTEGKKEDEAKSNNDF